MMQPGPNGSARGFALALGVAAGLGAAFPAAGQAEVFSVMQVTIVADPAKPIDRPKITAFRQATLAIRSCPDAIAVARRFRGNVFWREKVPLAALPAPLAAELRARPEGRATSVFRSKGGFRVLVRCPASFRLEKPAAPGPLTV